MRIVGEGVAVTEKNQVGFDCREAVQGSSRCSSIFVESVELEPPITAGVVEVLQRVSGE